MPVNTVIWKNRKLTIIDQTLLPGTLSYIELNTVEDVWEAIKVLRVRGAPAIGICAAYGAVVAAMQANEKGAIHAAIDYLASSRPTAVNLFYALERMRNVLEHLAEELDPEKRLNALEEEATRIFEEDAAMCRAIGEHGSSLIKQGYGILTHCNAGGLATSGYGTALAPLYVSHEKGIDFKVYADETRPLLQGARLTAWELMQSNIDVTLICDNMAAQVMREGKINMVIVGADRIAANGDTANKIGTYGVAVLARAHNIPFYVAAPRTTFDMKTPCGNSIPIEQRDSEEIIKIHHVSVAPDKVKTYNPAFDITPAALITGFITDIGIIEPPYTCTLVEKVASIVQ